MIEIEAVLSVLLNMVCFLVNITIIVISALGSPFIHVVSTLELCLL